MNVLNDYVVSKLYLEAEIVSKNAYTPYSKFQVGCAALTNDDKIFVGCNVENAAYNVIHAEESAISACISAGYTGTDIKAIAVYGNAKSVSPCGSCRQLIMEFGENIIVIFKFDGKILQMPITELLPYKFEL